jgi:hypothetical protein
MKKILNNVVALLIVLSGTMQGCQDFEELEKDPNRPTNVTPGLVLNGVMNSMYESPWNSTQRWNQFNCCNYNYYGNQEYNWTFTALSYTTLKNVLKMEEEALRSGLPEKNAYAALGKFFRAWFYYRMTMLLGDLPQSEALDPSGTQKPAYDTQKQIFLQILNWLEESNADMASLISSGDASFTGDIYFGNDMRKWQKAVNTFKLRVLIQLSKKEGDGELGIKAKFAEVIADKAKYPVMESVLDNLAYVYNNQFNKYPINPDNFGFDATRYNYSSTYISNLVQTRDPRIFFVAEPAGAKLKAGLQPTDHNAFVGASPSQDLGDMSSKAGTDNGAGYLPGEYSFFSRRRYYSSYMAENCIQLGYPELCFNIAEAINRGWVSGDAEEWYTRGIKASHAFYGVKNGENDVFFFKAGGTPTNSADYNKYSVVFDWDTYYNQPSVQYAGGATGLQQILLQKYLAFFQNSGWEAYFNYRRTGVPAFADGGPGTGNSGRIPKRFQYPPSENSTNGENLSAALSRQFAAGKDDINETIWVIK